MDHRVKTFVFITGSGGEVKLTSRKYNFQLEEVIKKRFTEELLTQYAEKGELNFNIELDHVREDFPKLLVGDKLEDIDWSEQDYDEIISVYLFFIQYRKNAVLRLLEQEHQTLASALETLKKTIDLMSQGILDRNL